MRIADISVEPVGVEVGRDSRFPLSIDTQEFTTNICTFSLTRTSTWLNLERQVFSFKESFNLHLTALHCTVHCRRQAYCSAVTFFHFFSNFGEYSNSKRVVQRLTVARSSRQRHHKTFQLFLRATNCYQNKSWARQHRKFFRQKLKHVIQMLVLSCRTFVSFLPGGTSKS